MCKYCAVKDLSVHGFGFRGQSWNQVVLPFGPCDQEPQFSHLLNGCDDVASLERQAVQPVKTHSA